MQKRDIFNVLKSRLQKKKGLTYDELVNNVKDVLDELPIHIYFIKFVISLSFKSNSEKDTSYVVVLSINCFLSSS
tara:strand:+ start:874 stop:1098 length:225 start_codon:yes stop_codon:yes gene_type:complete